MIYDDHGKLEMKTDAYGKTTAYLWSEEGQYLIAKAENGTPDDLTYYTSTDRLKSRNFSANTLITTYDYIPLVGKIQEFDARGRGLYYAYDNDGDLIGIRDHEGNIRKMYTSQIRNESGNRRESGKNIKSIYVNAKIPEPHVYASFSESEGKVSVMCQDLHPAFRYKLEEDNGSIHEIENGDRTFVLSAKEGIRAYTLRQYKEDIIVGEFYDEVQVEFAPLSVSFSSEDILTTTPLGDKRRTGIILKASAEGADGDYDFRWEVLSAPRGFSPILLLDYYFDNSTKAKLTDVPAGIYHVRCYVQSNGEIKTKDWEFIISDGGY
jgi:YD repeat-containing protein